MSKTREYFFVDGEDEETRSYQVARLSETTFQVIKPCGEVIEVDAFSPGESQLHLIMGAKSINADVRREENYGLEVLLEGGRHRFQVLNARERRMQVAGGGLGEAQQPELVSPMAGKVVQVSAEVGSLVEAGDSLVVVEAMKMENDLKAHRSGVVTQVVVEAGQAVEIGDVLVVIEDQEEEA